jgi:aerobic C4-dicarboxylate transport protein
LTAVQQLTVFAVATLTSKGASGVPGASFIALVATLTVVPALPVASMALPLGIERFMSTGRALVNMIGNGVTTIVIARWEKELDRAPRNRKMLELRGKVIESRSCGSPQRACRAAEGSKII